MFQNRDVKNYYCNYPRNITVRFYNAEIRPKGVDKMANSVDPDPIAPKEQADMGL